MRNVYRSKYEAYPFLSDKPDDLRCDYEILTDEIASMIGLLRAMADEKNIREQLLFVCELVYHLNPSLRTKTTVTLEELEKLDRFVCDLKSTTDGRCKKFVLTQGSIGAGMAHVLRAKCKSLVRLLYRHYHQGNAVDEILFDFANLLSGYFFLLALKLNQIDGFDEIEYISRNY